MPDKFDRLLAALPAIAESVNAFESKDVQKSAFAALVAALGVSLPEATAKPTKVAPTVPINEQVTPAVLEEESEEYADESVDPAKKAGARRPRKATAKKDIAPIRDLDLWPPGKQSIDDFIAEKKPKSQQERQTAAVFYLEQVLELPGITPGHVLAVFKHCKWPEPPDTWASLRSTANKTNFINTSSSTAIKTTPQGRNLVEHELPVVAKKAVKG